MSLTPSEDFETLEEALQQYVDFMEAHEGARFLMADLALRVKERAGVAGLNALAQTTHRKRSTLEQEARVARIAEVRASSPTLSFTHFSVVARMDRPEAIKWLDRAADSDWSPAELRRAVASARGHPDGPEIVVKRADSSAERFKGIIDDASALGVLDEVREKAEGIVSYAKSKTSP